MRKSTIAVLAAVLSVAPLADAIAATTVTGKVMLKLTVTIASSIAPSIPIQCNLSAYASGSNPSGSQTDNILETDQVTATRSGSTAVCQLAIPYQWVLYGSADTVALSYSVTATDPNSNGRYSSISFETIAVPKTGATTSYALSARI
jgi:hypothetical protein